MSYANYGPRTDVHPTRHGPRKTTQNKWVVLHTSEGGELTNSAEALSAFMRTPATKSNVASYNCVFDTNQVLLAVPYDVVPYAAGGGNAQGIHGCFPGRANQTRAQWLDETSFAMIEQAALWILDVCDRYDIPPRRITWQQVKNGEMGICDHYDITRAFKKSTHTDVGVDFPWDVLFDEIDAALYPSEPDQPSQPTQPTTPIDPQKDNDMIGLDLGNPPGGSAPADSWWTRMTYTGDSICHVRSPFDQLQVKAKINIVPIKETELSAMLDTVMTIGPSPFHEGGQAPNSALHTKWEQARGRT